MNTIQLKKSDSVLEFGILDENGNDTGNSIKFDLEDIELPLRLSESEEKHKDNLTYIKSQMIIIDKTPDEKGNGTLTKNQIKKYKVMQEFYQRERETLDLFLGEGGTDKFLNGRKPYYTMYEDINDLLKPILPQLYESADKVISRIKDKYKIEEKEDGVLTVDD